MASADDTTPTPGPFAALLQNAAARQFVAMVAIAASVALGVAVVLWTRAPTHKLLYANLSEQAAGEVVQALDAAGVDFRFEESTGSILVPSARQHEIRMSLAAQGLPSDEGTGMEILEEEPKFGMSSLQQSMLYSHAREVELARSIMTLKTVRRARVHVSPGNDSVFVRDRMPATASVVLEVLAGQKLSREKVSSIVHMVASSIPNLDPADVTVVDQFSNLLNSPDNDNDAMLSDRQYEQKRRQETALVASIESLLAPVIGTGRLTAQVNAELDFSVTEQTSELFDPAGSTVRSERTEESERRQAEGEGGVPGALANQPPVAGQNAAADAAQSLDVRNNVTRNFETGRRITTTRDAVGEIVKLSVAVIVDNVRDVDEEGNPTDAPRTAEQLAEIERLVQQAVGFDAERGDTIEVVNAAFQLTEAIGPLVPPEFWQQPWFLDIVRQVVGLLLALIVFFRILRPIARGIIEASKPVLPPPEPMALPDGGAMALPNNTIDGELEGPSDSDEEPEATIEERVTAIRQVAGAEPERVANIMKEWVGDEDG